MYTPLKVSFSNKKYPITSIFLIENPIFNGILKFISAQNHLPITCCTDLECNKTLNARNSTPTHTNYEPLISEVIRKYSFN